MLAEPAARDLPGVPEARRARVGEQARVDQVARVARIHRLPHDEHAECDRHDLVPFGVERGRDGDGGRA